MPANVGDSCGFTNDVFLPTLILVPSTGGKAGYGTGYTSNGLPVMTTVSASAASPTLVRPSNTLSVGRVRKRLGRLPVVRVRRLPDLSFLSSLSSASLSLLSVTSRE